jgi:hypothetical protein
MCDHAFEVQDVAADQLPEVEQDWAQLARHAAEPNPFYEPWMLLPALTAIKAGNHVRAALVWQMNPRTPIRSSCWCDFPYSVERSQEAPISVSRILSHVLLCGTPLLHKVHQEALEAYSIDERTWRSGQNCYFRQLPPARFFTGRWWT